MRRHIRCVPDGVPRAFSGNTAWCWELFLIRTVPEKSVRNIAGNKDELRSVGLDALLFLLAHPAEFREHGCEVVGFGAAKAALIFAEKLTPDFHIADPIRFENKFRITLDNMGWTGPRYDDYTSVAYWYQTLPSPEFPKLPSADELELL